MKISNILRSSLSVVLLSALLALPAQTVFAADKGGHHFSKHTIGLFLGVTNADEAESSSGLEYEYRVSDGFGWGALYESTPDGHHEAGVDVILATANWHPNNSWRLTFGVGQETVGATDDGHGHATPEITETVTRLGAAYDFHFSHGWGLAPTVNIDFVDGETVEVYGLVLMKGF